jgi:hypothetical protein
MSRSDRWMSGDEGGEGGDGDGGGYRDGGNEAGGEEVMMVMVHIRSSLYQRCWRQS